MKTAKIATIGAASVFAVVVLLLAVPAMAATQNTITLTSSTSTSVIPAQTALAVGQTITLTSANGVWRLISAPTTATSTTTTVTESVIKGPASGTMVLTVTGAYKGGYSLSLTSGTVSIDGVSYAFGTGSALMGPRQAHLVGQGTIAGATPGSFLFSAGAHANFQGKSYNTLRLDVEVNGMEYGVLLLVTAVVS